MIKLDSSGEVIGHSSLRLVGGGALVRQRRPRPFENAECRFCGMKGSSYCWNNCPFNIWRARKIEQRQ